MVDAKMRKKTQIMLPEEVHELRESRDDLLESMMMLGTINDEEPKGKRGKHLVIIADNTSETEGEQEEKTDDEDVYKTKVQDDTPNDDFFEVNEGEEEPQYGAIEGMSEVAEDEENEYHAQARRLSVFVQHFDSETDDSRRTSVARKSNAEGEEEAEVERKESKQKEITVHPDDSAARMRRLTKMMSIDQSARIASSLAAFKGRELMNKARLTIDLSNLQLPSIIQKDTRMYRKSILPPAMPYDTSTRVASEADIMDFFDLEKIDTFFLPESCEKEIEAEEVVSVVEEEPEPLDRTPFYEKYDECAENILIKKLRNNVLQKQVSTYLKRRRVECFLSKESSFHLDQQLKYQDKLDAYQQILEFDVAQRNSITEELEVLKEKSGRQLGTVKKLFKNMQARQNIVGSGLIYTKTGATISDKLVERLLKRQKIQMDQVSTMRLKYLKLKGMVQEKLEKIENTDKLENNLRLADYEQLKVDNRNYYDKIEEREEELIRLRGKCQNTIQVLAHMREKTQALESDIDDLREELYFAAETADDHRAAVAAMKHTRDKYRKLIVDIKMESGLLIHSDLLRDMEEAQQDLIQVNEELDSCRNEFRLKSNQIKTLRKNIERLTEDLDKKKKMKAKQSWTTLTTASIIIKTNKSNRTLRNVPMVYDRRPTLQVPTIEQEAFKDLIKIAPNPKILTRRR